jgi:ribonuclease G
MYSPGDAVAKVDGYIISVKGATKLVGQKHLVRIEEVGRTQAVASLVDSSAAGRDGGPTEGGEPEDPVESKPRRRGRRGGRRRSAARAKSASTASD